ncbi:MAG: glycosyltransferase [Acidobacteriota bacterium]
MTTPFRVVALIAAYNEADVIGAVITHLVKQQVDVYVIDNCSTDDTRRVVEEHLGHGVIGMETFPGTGAKLRAAEFRWSRILKRKEVLAQEMAADWVMHHDADEFRESPWPNLTLRDGIRLVDRLGYNAVDFDVFNFWPTTVAPPEPGPDGLSAYFERAESFDRKQVKCWKRGPTAVDLVTSGGHDVQFQGRRIYPQRFILRHYPIRSQAHGERKVFAERRPRFAADERDRGWHVQYDKYTPGISFERDVDQMTRYDADVVRAELAIGHRGVEALQQERDEAIRAAETVHAQLEGLQVGARADREAAGQERARLVEERQVLEAELAGVRADARTDREAAGQERARLVGERQALEAELAGVRADARTDREAAGRERARLVEERQALEAELAGVRADREAAGRERARLVEERQALKADLAGARANSQVDRETIQALRGRLEHETHAHEVDTERLLRTAQSLEAAEALVQARSAEVERLSADVRSLYASRTWRWTAAPRAVFSTYLNARAGVVQIALRPLAVRYVVGAARKAWVAWLEGRLRPSPADWRRHLRNYYAEIAPTPLPSSATAAPADADSPVLERADSQAATTPRFLVVSDSVPTPDLDSGSFRMIQLLKILRGIGHEVTFISHKEDTRPQYVDQLARLGISIVLGPQRAVDHLVSDGRAYHWAIISRPEVASHYLFPIRANALHAAVVYDTVDLHWVRLSRRAELSGDLDLMQQAREYQRMELFASSSSDLVLTVTEDERARILAEDPQLRVEVVPNIHPVHRPDTGWAERSGLLFVGGFWHHPNEDAVRHFVAEILPMIRRDLPDVVLTIIGSHMPEHVQSLASSAVRAVGYVDDLTPYFAEARVFVSPLRYGAGMKGKVGQSMSHGLPVVTTSVGAEGMLLTDGETALIADGPEVFAEAVVRLYSDQQLWRHVAERSLAHIESHFSDGVVRRRVEELFPLPGSASHAPERATTMGEPWPLKARL